MPSAPASARRSRSSRRRSPPSRRPTSTASPSSTPTGPASRRRQADVSLPFGGVPTAHQGARPGGGLALHRGVARVPGPQGAPHQRTTSQRLFERGGVTPVGQTTASEFGGLNVSVTKINGVTHNPWQHGRTVGGSSSGSAAAVAGGLVSLATGGDGGGSIRIPAGYTGPARHEGHLRSHPAQPARLHAPAHRRARQPQPLGARRRPRLRRVRRRPPRGPDQPAVARRVGGRASARRTCAACASRSSRTSAASTLEPGVEDRIREEAKALIADNRHGGGRPARRAAEPRRPVGDGQPRHAARRPRRQVAGVLRRPHRRDGRRPAPGRGACTTSAPRRPPRSCGSRPTR